MYYESKKKFALRGRPRNELEEKPLHLHCTTLVADKKKIWQQDLPWRWDEDLRAGAGDGKQYIRSSSAFDPVLS